MVLCWFSIRLRRFGRGRSGSKSKSKSKIRSKSRSRSQIRSKSRSRSQIRSKSRSRSQIRSRSKIRGWSRSKPGNGREEDRRVGADLVETGQDHALAVDQNPGGLLGVVSFVQLCIDALEFGGKSVEQFPVVREEPFRKQVLEMVAQVADLLPVFAVPIPGGGEANAESLGYFPEAVASGAESDELGVRFSVVHR
jgi:hypothetical protein